MLLFYFVILFIVKSNILSYQLDWMMALLSMLSKVLFLNQPTMQPLSYN